MISRRNRRPISPQESLRQFALNSSKGVDSSKSPVDTSTICYSNNLIVNPDGSVSIRKPIKYVDSGLKRQQASCAYYLYDNASRLVFLGTEDPWICILDENGNAANIYVEHTGYTGKRVTISHGMYADLFKNLPKSVTNLNSTTILGGCDVYLSYFGEEAVDASLYDEEVPETFPRYVQIERTEEFKTSDNDAPAWIFRVKDPEPNTLTAAEGEIPLNPNLNLDSPLTVRDEYLSTVPSIKGILAYTHSDINADGKLFPVTSGADVPNIVYDSLKSYNTWNIPFVLFKNNPTVPPVTVTIAAERVTDPEYGQAIKYTCTASSDVAADYIIDISLKLTFTMSMMSPVSFHKSVSSSVALRLDLRDGADSSSWTAGTEYMYSGLYTPTIYVMVNLATATAYPNTDETLSVRVADITESKKKVRPRIVSAVAKNTVGTVYLKAFGALPKPGTEFYAAWFKSKDGITWTNLLENTTGDRIYVRELSDTYVPRTTVEGTNSVAPTYQTNVYLPFKAESIYDDWFVRRKNNGVTVDIPNRIDLVLGSKDDSGVFEAVQYRFKIVTVTPITKADPEYDNTQGAPETQYRATATVDQADYTPVVKDDFEFFEIEFGNTVYGKKLYYKKALYSYGDEKFFNNIFVSDIDSFITPLYNVIDLDTYTADSVTCLVPWRDYLVSATSNAVYLHSKIDGGFLTKTVNTSIGISESDSRCCKAVLNGILFKSGPKVYQLYPNLYSGDDSTLNLTEISKAVEDILEEYADLVDSFVAEVQELRPGYVYEYSPFAFSTSSEYILMLPKGMWANTASNFRIWNTLCLRYDYTSKLWTVCTYPTVLVDYKILSLDDIRLFGTEGGDCVEYRFDAEPTEYDANGNFIGYGDVMSDGRVSPIDFVWDTGQKTDNIAVSKQFVESKLMFATEDLLESFPMELKVHIDGDPHVTTLDVNTDAPFWKTSDSVGVANTAFRLSLDDTSSSKVLRQLIVRYSGKGRSIRHILKGSATSNFRLYETYVRYKTLNVKR